MEPIDYVVQSQSLRIMLGLPINFFSWSFWSIEHKPYTPRAVVKVSPQGESIEYTSMKKACIENGLSIKELRSRLKNPEKTLSMGLQTYYTMVQWERQGRRHVCGAQNVLEF